MKRLILLFTLVLTFAACDDGKKEQAKQITANMEQLADRAEFLGEEIVTEYTLQSIYSDKDSLIASSERVEAYDKELNEIQLKMNQFKSDLAKLK